MKIDELGLSARAYHVLQKAEIDTVEKLRKVIGHPLVKIGGIGSSVFNEIQEKLAALPLTNGERIRAMTDEELAKASASTILCVPKGGKRKCLEATCYECWLAWLKQPVEKEEI